MIQDNDNDDLIGYNGNPLLKKPKTTISWTKEMVDEFTKCKQDPIYFAEKYIKIVTVDRGLETIVLYDYQKEIIQKFQNNRKLAILQSRQSGKTTVAVCIILHYIIFNKKRNRVALLANKADAAREILDRIKTAYEVLPDWLQHGIKKWNEGSITLENGTTVVASATTSSSIRGKSVNLLYIDECAFIPKWDEFAASVLPTLSSGVTTQLMYTSTPCGLNHYYKICTGAKEGTNGFAYVEVKWDRVPGRDEAWKKNALEELNYDYEKFDQEYDVQFQGSSGTLITGSTLKTLFSINPIASKDGLTQYVAPHPDKNYVIICDVSRGKGLDYSAFQVIDISKMPYVQVCTYRSNMITPVDYASVIHMTSKMYNNSTILVEINDIGAQVSDTLYMDYGSENLIFTESAGAAGKRISAGFGRNVDKGIRTSKTVKSIGCSMLKLLVEQQQLIINDHNTIEELSRFSKKGNSYEAESGSHDDLVMGLVLFGWLSDQTYFKDLTDISTLQKLRDRSDEDIQNDMVSFGFYDDGLGDESIIDLTQSPRPEFINF